MRKKSKMVTLTVKFLIISKVFSLIFLKEWIFL